MSTRATISVKDSDDTFDIYKHSDGYPDGVIPYISLAMKYSWWIDRFEAGDFAAALVRVTKDWAGHIYLTKKASNHWDRAYHYDITRMKSKSVLRVVAYSCWGEGRLKLEKYSSYLVSEDGTVKRE